MPRKVIDVAHLREVTKQNKDRIEEERARVRTLAEDEQKRRTERLVRSIYRDYRNRLPALLEKAFQEGENRVFIGGSLVAPEQMDAARMFMEYCERNGLQAEIVRVANVADGWDYHLVVSW